ncbi:Zip-like iron-zinc transporter [Mycena indigotica]|uniref:Zip-like iron-zinc transporter n=1 Tax=Mycena indigotica TaxID=2126181 RepID=A0A8H6RZJ5_9AGAR|nr:Zip-like iron-zinc transporter [Mycena indigotica]KAF7290600.1 Zip-like iron-zinc transporter [Mycena indigotica]
MSSSISVLAGKPMNNTPKIYAIFGIFLLSLFAVSFPSISKRTRLLRIPHVAFFIGKHFGTGVILSTAFCHLLQDSFEHLQNPILKKKYPKVGEQTGLIILSSLLFIFFVEYISTSYVDFLHAESSAPSSPAISAPPSRPHSPQPIVMETTPLLVPVHSKANPDYVAAILAPPRHCPLSRHDGRLLSICVTTANHDRAPVHLPQDVAESEADEPTPTIGRGRQMVGIIVLELGIMLHSLVIGLTLALTTGGDFTSLLTAIIFHQLFEGLSLGIRIASLPPAKHHPRRDWFSITLSLLFALTTPLGLAVGVAAFNGQSAKSKPLATTLLIKGIMSAVSAGMLIYATTVEMLAADFVYGNLEDGMGHSHGHGGHSHDVEQEDDKPDASGKPASAGRRALALGSLLAGVGSMVLVSLGE